MLSKIFHCSLTCPQTFFFPPRIRPRFHTHARTSTTCGGKKQFSPLPTQPVPGSEIVGSAELRKRKHENKTGGNWGKRGRAPFFFFFPPREIFACLFLSRLPHYRRSLKRKQRVSEQANCSSKQVQGLST